MKESEWFKTEIKTEIEDLRRRTKRTSFWIKANFILLIITAGLVIFMSILNLIKIWACLA